MLSTKIKKWFDKNSLLRMFWDMEEPDMYLYSNKNINKCV